MTRELHNEAMRRHNDRLAQLEAIRLACIESNPERWNNPKSYETHMQGFTIRLSDILQAVKAKCDYAAWQEIIDFVRRNQWNTLKDDITLQSDDCVAFLARLLTKDPKDLFRDDPFEEITLG